MYGIDLRGTRAAPFTWRGAAGLGAAALMAVWALPALASEELARDKRCLGCHAVDAKRVGPAFKDVARRYATQPTAAPMLAQKIREGGVGNWGPVPMTANSQVNEADAKKLVGWILSLK
jgi:cytochrome c